MSKIRISEEFTTSSTDFIRVATLEELKTASMIVVRGARCPLLVVHDDGKVFAWDICKAASLFGALWVAEITWQPAAAG